MKLRLLRLAFVTLTTIQVLLAIAASPLNILIGWVEALSDYVDEKAWENFKSKHNL